MEVVIGLTDGFVHARAVVVQCEMTRGKIVLDGKSKENLEKICGIQFFSLVFLSFWTVCAYRKLKQQQKVRFRRRLALFEQKNWHRFWAIKRFRF